MKPNVIVKKEILYWAVNESGISTDYLFSKKPFAKKVLEEKPITLPQAKSLTNFLKIPLGFLFLDSIPMQGNLYADFRTINNKKADKMSKDLKDVLLEMDYKKNWLSDYRKDAGQDKIALLNSYDIKAQTDDFANYVRSILKLPIDWFSTINDFTTFDYLREKTESLGFVVMLNGVVGNNTHRKLNIKEFRGFALADPFAPFIFINSCDNEKARTFTLMHEFVHLIASNTDDIVEQIEENLEEVINKVVAEVLMPKKILFSINNSKIKTEEEVRFLANRFKVNPLAMAFRLKTFGRIDDDLLNKLRDKSNNNISKKSTGGDFYLTKHKKISKPFAESVCIAVANKQISYPYGYRLLGVKRRGYSELISYYSITL